MVARVDGAFCAWRRPAPGALVDARRRVREPAVQAAKRLVIASPATKSYVRRALRHSEIAQRRRRHVPLRWGRELWNPAVRNPVGPVHGVGWLGAAPAETRIYVLPDDRAVPGDLEHASGVAGVAERVADGQPLRAADVRAEKPGMRVRPDQFEGCV